MTWCYIKSDGNGGFQIGKLLSVIVAILLFVSGIIVTVVAKDTQYKIDIENLKEQMTDTKQTVSEHSETIATLNANIGSITEDLRYIKDIMILQYGDKK